ncbi:hypothetical protein GOBAR_DD23133 [Gossypium barbadense]|nr:hypothetical protein GOBAR_DD23133 [Gossypium barbadense]
METLMSSLKVDMVEDNMDIGVVTKSLVMDDDDGMLHDMAIATWDGKGLLVLSLAWARSLSRRLLEQNVVFHYELVVLEQPLDGVLHIL